MNKKIYLIILVFSTILFNSKNIFAINTMNEGYQLQGAGTYINVNYPGSGSTIAGQRVTRNSGTSYVFVPTRSDAELNSFCSHASNVGASCSSCAWGSWATDCLSNNLWGEVRTSPLCGTEYHTTSGTCSYCGTNMYDNSYITDSSSPWVSGCTRHIICCINHNLTDFGSRCNYKGGCICLFVSTPERWVNSNVCPSPN